MSRILAGILAAALLAAPAAAQTVKLVTGNDYKPFTDEKLPEGGLFTELVREAYKLDGRAAEIAFLPWKRGFEMAKTGEVLATFPYLKTPEREADFLYSESVFDTRTLVYVKTGGFTAAKAEELAGKKMCLPIGYAPPAAIKAMMDAGTLTASDAKDMEACFKLVEAGRADFLQTNDLQAKETMAALGLGADKITALPFAVDEARLHLIVGKATAQARAEIDAFNKALAKLRETGAWGAIVKKHIPGY